MYTKIEPENPTTFDDEPVDPICSFATAHGDELHILVEKDQYVLLSVDKNLDWRGKYWIPFEVVQVIFEHILAGHNPKILDKLRTKNMIDKRYSRLRRNKRK
jgi:hypothetical protein